MFVLPVPCPLAGLSCFWKTSVATTTAKRTPPLAACHRQSVCALAARRTFRPRCGPEYGSQDCGICTTRRNCTYPVAHWVAIAKTCILSLHPPYALSLLAYWEESACISFISPRNLSFASLPCTDSIDFPLNNAVTCTVHSGQHGVKHAKYSF